MVTATEIETIVLITVIMIVVLIVLVKAILLNLILVKKNEGSNSTVSSISSSTGTNHNNL